MCIRDRLTSEDSGGGGDELYYPYAKHPKKKKKELVKLEAKREQLEEKIAKQEQELQTAQELKTEQKIKFSDDLQVSLIKSYEMYRALMLQIQIIKNEYQEALEEEEIAIAMLMM